VPQKAMLMLRKLSAITQNAPSALASKLSTPSFIARVFGHALEDSQSKSCLVQSLSVCIYLMDPKKLASNKFIPFGISISMSPMSLLIPRLLVLCYQSSEKKEGENHFRSLLMISLFPVP
ncbi:Sit4 phosphatase-associated family protein, partial [Thalictrum thalictroides]